MKTIFLVTGNSGKFNSLRHGVAGYPIKVLRNRGEIAEIQADTVKEVAMAKVTAAYEKLKRPVVVNDGGFVIPSLNGFPGPYAKYILKTLGLIGILRLVQGTNRFCYFETALAFMDRGMREPQVFTDILQGKIAEISNAEILELAKKPLPQHLWSDLAYIFVPLGQSRPFGLLSTEDFENWRQELRRRHSYYRDFAEWLVHR